MVRLSRTQGYVSAEDMLIHAFLGKSTLLMEGRGPPFSIYLLYIHYG